MAVAVTRSRRCSAAAYVATSISPNRSPPLHVTITYLYWDIRPVWGVHKNRLLNDVHGNLKVLSCGNVHIKVCLE